MSSPKNIEVTEKELQTIISHLNEYADCLRGDACMPNTAFEMISKSGDVKLLVNSLKKKQNEKND